MNDAFFVYPRDVRQLSALVRKSAKNVIIVTTNQFVNLMVVAEP